MEPSIITYGTSLEASVNWRQLHLNTQMHHLSFIDRINWHLVEELHILKFSGTCIGANGELYSDSNTGCYTNDAQTWVLVLGATLDQIYTIINQCTESLKHLDLRCLRSNPLDLSRLSGLEKLCVSVTKGVYPIKGLERLTKLKELDLSFTDCQQLPELPGGLETLNLSVNPKLNVGSGLSNLAALEEIDLSCTDVDHLDLSGQSKLKRLRLVDTRSLLTLTGIEKNTGLEYVDLSHSAIRQIPDAVFGLKNLIRLDLSNLELEEFPDGMSALDMEYTYCDSGINLRGTRILGMDMDMDIFEQGPLAVPPRSEVLQWFEDYRQKADRPLKECKVIFLGNGEAGKTHTIARLLNDGGEPRGYVPETTPGVKIAAHDYFIDRSRMKIHFWDFGGQEHMFPIHFPFLTQDALYVVVLDAGKNPDDQAHYWLNIISIFAKNAPVLVVLNKTDTTSNPGINESGLKESYPNICGYVKMSALHDDRASMHEGLIKQIKAALKQIREDQENPHPAWQLRSMSWHFLRDKLKKLKESEKMVISCEEFNHIAEDCGIEAGMHSEVLDAFNSVGFCYSCLGDELQERYVVLDPNWLTNALYTIGFNSKVLQGSGEPAKNGIVSHEDIKWMLNSDHAAEYGIKRILPDTRYTDEQIQYIVYLMRAYKLSVQMENGTELIPMMCRMEIPLIAVAYSMKPGTHKYRLKYQSLVHNVIHRLMIERRQELDLENTWNTGALFRRTSDASWALVCEEANSIRIDAFEENDMSFEGRYGKQLADDLYRISQEMGLDLERPQILCEVLAINPKSDRQSDKYAVVEFDTEEFRNRLFAKQEGWDRCYSKELGGMAKIMDNLFLDKADCSEPTESLDGSDEENIQ